MKKNYKKILIILTLAIGIYTRDIVQARAEIKYKSMVNIGEKNCSCGVSIKEIEQEAKKRGTAYENLCAISLEYGEGLIDEKGVKEKLNKGLDAIGEYKKEVKMYKGEEREVKQAMADAYKLVWDKYNKNHNKNIKDLNKSDKRAIREKYSQIGIRGFLGLYANQGVKKISFMGIPDKRWDFVKSRSECTKKDVNNEVKITFSEKEEIKEEIIKAADILVNSSDYQKN
ncbi:hypothetical protein [Rickettsiales endosymbiont of Trichoplax sp. H2]|uniref:hypothetical protein n=1 Tax=Rickettsiales endosymbiont of Trichoplax sp. H2 TaxID=2021221 RepID=UPI0012B1EA75|nr:hypothetical protein [Rickettsiales endosymbiont of Trichoplax sp. H2]